MRKWEGENLFSDRVQKEKKQIKFERIGMTHCMLDMTMGKIQILNAALQSMHNPAPFWSMSST